jgi:hypothetical protein
MLAPLVLDSCDPGIQIQTPEESEDLGDRVAGTVEEMRRAGAVATPEPGDVYPADSAGEVAFAVPVCRGGDDAGGEKMRVEEEVVDVPPGRAVRRRASLTCRSARASPPLPSAEPT